ncbi:MAG TPA: phenylalanine--tRNA ligase subunit beta [Geobacteraceae bacterium]|nr:phenylalanine--tRNA ligase subunit beta [Geobacteraceae bacterium]
MKVTYNWLKEFVDFDLAPEELAHLLTMLGLEVDSMEHTGEGLDDVIVALVEERSQHPNADKLSLCRVNNGREIINVVCGAQNFKSGDKVALAQIGATLPGDFKIKRSKIRGEESCGMLCSEKELELADESAGIMVLPPGLELGIPLFEALGLKDTVFEIGLTPNRADCLSVIGIAREIAAKLGKKLRYSIPEISERGADISSIASVEILDPDLCPRYTARYISGCTIAPSPQWLVNRLKAVGQRSINNVVDITNYVLMEYGHPLHAFDFRELAGGKIIVRRASDGETFKTLDGQERILNSSDLTIRDAERVVALAGIMGGENSEIAADTSNILLESAYFSPSAIRLTSKRLGLHTESSHRFERGTDLNILTTALDRAAALIAELSGGVIAKGLIDVFPAPQSDKRISVRVSRVNEILGLSLDEKTIAGIFRSLEFKVEPAVSETLLVDIPSFRVDIEREIDLIEEVARLHGYENIPMTMPVAEVISDRIPRSQALEREVKNLLALEGFNEVINFSFASYNDLRKLNLNESDRRSSAVSLLNPLVDEHAVMRTTLLPALLQTTARNFSLRNFNLRLFEMRRVYLAKPGSELPDEPLHVAGVLTGLRNPEGWNQSRDPVDFYDVKGLIESIKVLFKLPELTFVQGGVEPFYHPGKSAAILCRDTLLGTLGEIHPDVQEAFEIDKPVYYFELDFGKLVSLSAAVLPITPPSRFPDSYRDIAMLIDAETPSSAVVECIKGVKSDKIRSVEIFDLYTGDRIPEGRKSLAVRVRYGSFDRTLTDDEVGKVHEKIVNTLISTLGIAIR